METKSSSHENPPLVGCLEACKRCEEVIECIPNDLLTVTTDWHDSILAHARHCVDHLVCFARGLDSDIIDYDTRDRDRALEQDPAALCAAIKECSTVLRALDPARMDEAVRVRQIAGPSGEAVEVSSTVARELLFLSAHIIHHLALMVYLGRTMGVEVPADLSLAFSTAAYRAEHTASQQ